MQKTNRIFAVVFVALACIGPWAPTDNRYFKSLSLTVLGFKFHRFHNTLQLISVLVVAHRLVTFLTTNTLN